MTPKRYETAILFDPELPEDARKEFLGKLSGIVAGYKGEVLKIDDWGNRKLAYPIKKRSNGFYTFLLYTGSRGVVEEVERNIKISEGILRHLTTLHTADWKPKVEAAAGFVRDGGARAVIADLDDATGALRGETGTTIVPAEG